METSSFEQFLLEFGNLITDNQGPIWTTLGIVVGVLGLFFLAKWAIGAIKGIGKKAGS